MTDKDAAASNGPIPLATVNRLSTDDFVSRFGDIAEHSPWVAGRAAAARPYATPEAMAEAFAAAISAADRDAQEQLLLAHPDLAGRLAIAGGLTADSSREQAGAGLDRLTPAEHARMSDLNTAYRAKHGIPFIIAVKGLDKQAIMAAMASRLDADPATEFAEALRQVARITALRIADRVRP